MRDNHKRTLLGMRLLRRPYSATVTRPSSNKLLRPTSAKISSVKASPVAAGPRAQTWNNSNLSSAVSKSRAPSSISHAGQHQAGGERLEPVEPEEDFDELGDVPVADRWFVCVCARVCAWA